MLFEFESTNGIFNPERTKRPVKAVIFDKDLTLTDEAYEDEEGIELVADTLFWTNRLKLIPETLQLVLQLKSMDIRIGLLTNDWRAATDEVMARFGIMDFFDAIVARKEVQGEKKPHQAPFLHIAELLQVSPEQCIMIGDEPRDDIFGAQTVGMRTILVPREEHIVDSLHWTVEPDLVLLSRQVLHVENVLNV